MDFLAFDFMQRALLAGALIGLAAPAVGVFLVQRRLALMGDGIGHVTFMGIAAGLLVGESPIVSAIVFAVAGAVAIEILRQRGKTASDVALALVFYSGIAGGVLLLKLGNTSTINVTPYLFGSVLTVNTADLWIVAGVASLSLGISLLLRRQFFAVAYDEESARVSGLPVDRLNWLVATLAAVTVAVTSKIVGILLVASLLVLPVATVQQLTQSFRSTFFMSLALGVVVTIGGLVLAFYTRQYPAATIVLSSIALFALATGLRRVLVVR